MKKALHLIATGLVSAAAGFASPAWAGGQADQAAAPAQSDQAPTGVPDIVVTAQRRAQTIQDVPLAVSALSGSQLEKSGDSSFRDFALSIPSISFQPRGNGDSKVVLRGISSGIVREAATASTGYYFDDVPLSASYASGGTDITLFDINRIEVLRGPQGTLYGAGSEGGAIRVITNRPDATAFAGQIQLTGSEIAGKAGHIDARAMLNIPLVKDELAVRAVGVFTHDEGYIEDLQGKRLNGGELAGGRLAIDWTPTDDFKVQLLGIYQHTYYNSPSSVDLTLDKKPLYGDLIRNVYVPEFVDGKTRVANLVVTKQFPWATLMSSSSYARNVSTNGSDGSLNISLLLNSLLHLTPGGYIGKVPGSSESFIEELRLTSKETTPLSWVVGLYYQHSDIDVAREDRFSPSSAAGQLGLLPLEYHAMNKQQTYSIFGEATYHFTDQWAVTGGARYTRVPTSVKSSAQGVALGIPDPANTIYGSGSATTTDFSPKIELTFTPNRTLLFYAEAARGFRPGQANPTLPASFGIPGLVKPDHLWDYEVGAKTQFFDRRLVVNMAAYKIDWTNLQLVTQTNTNPRIPYFGNGGNVVSKGLELEVHVRPDQHWQFTFSGAYTDARFTTSNATIGVTKGQRIALVPQYSGSFAIDYQRPLTQSVDGYLHFDVRGQTNTPASYGALYQGLFTGPWAMGNVRIGATFAGGLDVALFVDNLWDKRAQLSLVAGNYCTTLSCASFDTSKSAFYEATIADPRTVGITISKRF